MYTPPTPNALGESRAFGLRQTPLFSKQICAGKRHHAYAKRQKMNKVLQKTHHAYAKSTKIKTVVKRETVKKQTCFCVSKGARSQALQTRTNRPRVVNVLKISCVEFETVKKNYIIFKTSKLPTPDH